MDERSRKTLLVDGIPLLEESLRVEGEAEKGYHFLLEKGGVDELIYAEDKAVNRRRTGSPSSSCRS